MVWSVSDERVVCATVALLLCTLHPSLRSPSPSTAHTYTDAHCSCACVCQDEEGIGQETINHVLVKDSHTPACPPPPSPHPGPRIFDSTHLHCLPPTPRFALFLCVWSCRRGGDWSRDRQSRPRQVPLPVLDATAVTSPIWNSARRPRTPAILTAYSKRRAFKVSAPM